MINRASSANRKQGTMMDVGSKRPLGHTGLLVSPIGFGSFKIGRNEKTKYAARYPLPDDAAVDRLLNGLLDSGINYFDTAPAYGVSEEQLGRAVSHRRDEFVLSTKVGETFVDGRSVYDFSRPAVRGSIDRSLKRLRCDVLDIVFIHSDANDVSILSETDVVATLLDLKAAGVIRAVGLSAKTVDGGFRSLEWSDAIMVEYHQHDVSQASVIDAAGQQGVGVVVKKGLASGRLSASEALPFVLKNRHVGSLVVGSLSLEHMQANLRIARQVEFDSAA